MTDRVVGEKYKVDVLTAPRATTLCPAIRTFEEKDRGSSVDSFNFDPRSARLNTEMGLVIDSAALSRPLGEFFYTTDAAGVLRGETGSGRDRPAVVEPTSEGVRVHDTEPDTYWFGRFLVGVLSPLPMP